MIQKQYALICDIDNCFTDSRAWYDMLGEDMDRKDWDEFQKHVTVCTPNQPIIDLCCSTVEILPVIFLTGREDRLNQREDTIKQIEEFSKGKIKINGTNRLIMRKEFDYRSSDVVKEEMLCALVKEGYIPICAIDDEEINCALYKKYDIPTVLYKIEGNEFIRYHKHGEND